MLRVAIVSLVLLLAVVACGSDESLGSDSGVVNDAASESAGGGSGRLAQITEQLIVREGEIRLSVDNVPETARDVTRIAVSEGGRVQSVSIEGPDGQDGATIVVRVPVDRFDAFMSAMRPLAVLVLSEQASSEDVTEEHVDLDARLRNLQRTEIRFLDLMDQAESIPDILRVQSELTTVGRNIETLQGRLQFLERSAAESRIQVTLRASRSAVPLIDRGWDAFETARSAVRGLTGTLQVVADIAIWLVVLSPVWGGTLALVIWLRRHPFRWWQRLWARSNLSGPRTGAG